jgi:DNA-binding MarR family transcriptional regulator
MKRKQPGLAFETLKGRARQIVTRLTNAIAFQNRDCCSVDDFARQFKTTPARLKTTLKRLEEAGLIEVTGDMYQQVVPTTKLLRHQDRNLSEAQAAKLIGQYKRGRYK